MPEPRFDTLASVAAWWIELRCGCDRVVFFPVKMLVARYGPDHRPEDVLARMRCQSCGAAPGTAALVEQPQHGAQGYVGTGPGRRVTLRDQGNHGQA